MICLRILLSRLMSVLMKVTFKGKANKIQIKVISHKMLTKFNQRKSSIYPKTTVFNPTFLLSNKFSEDQIISKVPKMLKRV